MRTIFAVVVAFGIPSILAAFVNMETVPFAAAVGFTGTVAFTLATLIDKGVTGSLIRRLVLATPIVLALVAANLAGPEAKGMMLAICFYLFIGCCSAAVAALLISKNPSFSKQNDTH